MPPEPGKPSRKLPERGDALKIDLPFDEAVRAALQTRPLPDDEPAKEPAAKKRRRRDPS
jgi:hypothetical protein